MGSNAPDPIEPYRVGFDASGYYCLPQTVLRAYQDNWNTFNRIQIYNITASTFNAQNFAGGSRQLYYQFQSFVERTQFTNGRALHIRRYPNSNWAPVSEA